MKQEKVTGKIRDRVCVDIKGSSVITCHLDIKREGK